MALPPPPPPPPPIIFNGKSWPKKLYTVGQGIYQRIGLILNIEKYFDFAIFWAIFGKCLRNDSRTGVGKNFFKELFSVRITQIHHTCDSRVSRISWNFNNVKIRMFPDTNRNFSFKHHLYGVLDELRESWSCKDNTKLVNMPYFGSLLSLE